MSNEIKNVSTGCTEVIEEHQKPVGVIGIPHTGLFHWQTMMSLLSLKLPSNYQIKYHFIGSCLIYDARDKIIKFAQKEKAEWVFFLDSDMVPPPDTLIKLLGMNVPMCSGMAFKRTPPFQPCFYVTLALQENKLKLESPLEFPNVGILECQGFGMACALIKSEVFEKVEAPHFYPHPKLGEDLTFCLKVRKAGFKMYVDLSIDCGHVASMAIGKDHFREAYKFFKETSKPGDLLFKEDIV